MKISTHLSDVKIAWRLIAAFGLMLALMAGITAIGAMSSRSARDNVTDSVERANAKSVQLAAMRQALFHQGLAARNMGATNDLARMQAEMAKIGVGQQQYLDAEGRLQALRLDPAEQTILEEMRGYAQQSAPLIKQAESAAAGFNAGQALKILTMQVAPLQDQWLGAIDRMAALQSADIARSLSAFEQDGQRATALMVLICAIAMSAGLLVAWRLSRSITQPLQQALALAQRVAVGDLTLPRGSNARAARAPARDETGQLLAALHGMQANLARTVSAVRTGADTINVASAEIASGNANLSSRTESQASALQQTASSMETLTGAVRQNAEHAQQASVLAATAAGVAVQGGAVVAGVVATMDGIRSSSHRIMDIIAVIDGIAFQTNILALNAAVEAARAGEQGRGFAVVASEVRHLAQRSASAAREIKELIGDSVGRIDEGSAQVDTAGATMQRIVSAVQQVADCMQDITSASALQSEGIAQVNRAIGQMDDMTQQNAALVEQAAAAAASLRDQAQVLAQAAGVFRLHA